MTDPAAAYQFNVDTDQPCATCWHRRGHDCLRLDIHIHDPQRSTCPAHRERPAGVDVAYAEQRTGMVLDFVLNAMSLDTLRVMHADAVRTRDAGPWYNPAAGWNPKESARIQQEWREAWGSVVEHMAEIIERKEQDQP
jgi:hypothetical protein